MSNLSTLPKGDSAWLLRKAIERIIDQVSVLETNIGVSTSGNSADTQIIFNDAGTLRGDAGLVYNKTTDALTVAGLVTAGSATITGALTVDTSTLVVDATNDRVGMGTATPGSRLDVRFSTNPAIDNAVPTNALRVFTSVAQAVDVGGQIGLGGLYNATDIQAFGNISGKKENSTSGNNAGYLVFGTCNSGGTMAERYRIDSSGISTWSVAGTTAMTLNSTGLGIGDAPATNSRLTIGSTNATGFQYALRTTGVTTGRSQIYLNNTSGDFIGGIESSVAGTSITGTAAYSGYVGTSTTNPFHIVTNGSVKATVLSSGNFCIGNTSGDVGLLYVRKDSLTVQVVQIGNEALTGKMITFHTNGNNQVGSISFTNSAVAYNTSSDYRLKESVKPISGGLARVNALKPSAYKWKVDGSNGEGFLAHELAEVVPAAVTGDKDAVDADGKPAYQGVDLSKIVPILVAAIQELTARVQTLEAR